MGTGGGAALWWDTINHFKVKGSKVPSFPLEGRRQAPRGLLLSAARGFPAAARRRGSSAALRGSHFPGAPSPARTAGPGLRSWQAAAVWLSRRSGSPSAQAGSPPARPRACAFPFLSKRERPAPRGWRSAGGLAAPGLPETRAPCDLLCKKGRGRAPASRPGGGQCEFLRKTPLDNTKTFQNVALPFLPFCGLPSCPLLATRPGPHLRPCQGPRHRFSSPPPLLSSISSLTFPRPRLG